MSGDNRGIIQSTFLPLRYLVSPHLSLARLVMSRGAHVASGILCTTIQLIIKSSELEKIVPGLSFIRPLCLSKTRVKNLYSIYIHNSGTRTNKKHQLLAPPSPRPFTNQSSPPPFGPQIPALIPNLIPLLPTEEVSPALFFLRIAQSGLLSTASKHIFFVSLSEIKRKFCRFWKRGNETGIFGFEYREKGMRLRKKGISCGKKLLINEGEMVCVCLRWRRG